jgi:hypothetical protein
MKNTKTNPWLSHLSKVRAMKQNKGKTLTECMKIAKSSYKK